MVLHIHGPLTREQPRPGTKGLQKPLIPEQAQGTGSKFLRLPPHTYFTSARPLPLNMIQIPYDFNK